MNAELTLPDFRRTLAAWAHFITARPATRLSKKRRVQNANMRKIRHCRGCKMADTENLNSVLLIGQVNDAELSSVLLSHFGNAMAGMSNEAHFSHRDKNKSGNIKLTYRNGEIISADGSDLKTEEITLLADKVKRELVETPGTVPARCILLSSFRVTGSFGHGTLCIYPVPDDAPKAPDLTYEHRFVEQLTIEHPFVAEFPINRSVNFVIQFERSERQARKYALLLNLFLEGKVSRVSRGRQRHWVHEEGTHFSSGYKYLREGYRYNNFGDTGIEPDFFLRRVFPPMETMRYNEYFTDTRHDLNPPMRVSTLLPTFLDRFEKLDKVEQARFLRSAFWFHHASNVSQESNTASYLAIVSSIESLIPKPDGSQRRRGDGATKRFVDFLNQIVPVSEKDAVERKRLFTLRSDLTHGWDLFHADAEALRGLNPKSTDEFHSYTIAMDLAREALLNWLMKKTGGWPKSD